MNNKQSKSLLKLLGLTSLFIVLNACSSEPSPWAKSESPWDQRRANDAEAPAADSYKAELEMPETTTSEVELDYQAEPVEAYAPGVEATVEEQPEPVLQDSMAEQAVEGSFMDQPASYYTVQLIASVDIDRVYKFANQNQLSTQYIVPTQRDGVTWHVLLLGVYPDYSSAVVARDDVAASLNTQPWVRSVGSVQKLMR